MFGTSDREIESLWTPCLWNVKYASLIEMLNFQPRGAQGESPPQTSSIVPPDPIHMETSITVQNEEQPENIGGNNTRRRILET